MIKFLIYLIEASALLAVFYLLYVVVLKKETFFGLNRFFLIGIVVFSLLFPVLSFDISQGNLAAVDSPVAEISKFRNSYYEAVAEWEFENFNQSGNQMPAYSGNEADVSGSMDWWNMLMMITIGIYVVGIIFCLSKMFWSMRWLIKMIRIHPVQQIDDIKVVKMPNPVAPFSFLNYAFVYEGIIGTPELDQIIAHEKAHIRQKHSVDLILVQFLAAFQWFNPLIWQLIKSLKTTHEYIADKKIINSGYSLVEYQTLLLSQLISNNSYGLVHNFNLSFIKKRITMMKNNQSGIKGGLRVALSLVFAAVVSLVIVQCNSKMEEDNGLESQVSTVEIDGQINLPVVPDIKSKVNYNQTDVIVLHIKANELTIDGVVYENADLPSLLDNSGISNHGVVIMKVDKDQRMGKVRDVQTELRRANRRKVLYEAQTATGKLIQSAMLLPPLPGDNTTGAPQLPTFDLSDAVIEGNIAKKYDMEFLKVDLGGSKGVATQTEVYDFVKSHEQRESTAYVVSAKFDDADTYGSYMTNLIYVQEGFNQLYQERSAAMFGKDFYELDKPEYNAVRKNVPRSISVAES
ncbi:MAG: M56 family metallopeptidase [Bacteroidota bacterium]